MIPSAFHRLLLALQPLALLAAGLLLPSCGVVVLDAAAEATGACQTDADCAPLKCFEQRVCVAAEVPATPVILRLQPPPASGLLVEHFEAMLSGESQGQSLKLMLTEPAVVHGTVVQTGNPLATSIAGTLLATAPGVAGRNLSYTATSFESAKAFAGTALPHGFELRVQPGHTYDLTFWPQSEQIPPHYSSITVGGSLDEWLIALPAENELGRVTGRMVAGCQDGLCTPIPGLRIALEDAKGRLCSTRAVTDADGQFELRVDPSAPWAVLRFEPADAKATLPSGRMQHGLSLGKPGLKGTPVELGTVDVGALPAAVEVAVVVRAADGGKLPGAQVRIVRQLQPPADTAKKLASLYVEAAGIANADGVFTASLPYGPAKVVVTPGVKSASARWTWTGELVAGELQAVCPPRRLLTGRVVDFAQRRVAHAELLLRRLGPQCELPATKGGNEAAGEAAIEVVADAQGDFSALLDPGCHAVWIQPPAGSGLARVLADKLVQVPELAPVAPVQLVVPPPMVLVGQVHDAKGVAVAGVLVDVLAAKLAGPLPAGLAAPEGNTGDALMPGVLLDSHLLASTVSTGSGAFEVLLAPGQVAP